MLWGALLGWLILASVGVIRDPWRLPRTSMFRTVPRRPCSPTSSSDREECRQMGGRDVQWLFKLLPLCPELRLFLKMGPIIGADLKPMPSIGFLCEFPPRFQRDKQPGILGVLARSDPEGSSRPRSRHTRREVHHLPGGEKPPHPSGRIAWTYCRQQARAFCKKISAHQTHHI